MPTAAFAGDIAYDWELWIGRGEVPTWTQVFGFESLPMPDQVPEDVDVTHMQSPGRTRETIPGLLPVAEFSQDKQMWPEDDGDVLIEELAALTAAGTREVVLLEFNVKVGTGTVGGSRRTYRGYINSYNPTGTVGDKAMATTNVKILDRQATNTRTIA